MIDVESEVFNAVAGRLRTEFSGIFVTGEYVASPSSFPCVSLVEIDNATFRNSLTQDSTENHVAITYEVNIYSNLKTGKKSQCKSIAKVVDDVLAGLNFTRMMIEPVPNQNDATIYRMLGRYRAVASESTIYRR